MTLAGKNHPQVGRLGYSICIKVNCISGDCCFDSEQEARTVAMFLLLPT